MRHARWSDPSTADTDDRSGPPSTDVSLALTDPVAEKAVALARTSCGAPIAALWLADGGRRWIRAVGEVGEAEARQLEELCTATEAHGTSLVVSDTGSSSAALRFFAGHVLETSDRQPIGVLCVADRVPRELDLLGRSALAALAVGTAAHVDLLWHVRRFGDVAEALRAQLAELSTGGGSPRAAGELRLRLLRLRRLTRSISLRPGVDRLSRQALVDIERETGAMLGQLRTPAPVEAVAV